MIVLSTAKAIAILRFNQQSPISDRYFIRKSDRNNPQSGDYFSSLGYAP
jgi:hypothetical protein